MGVNIPDSPRVGSFLERTCRRTDGVRQWGAAVVMGRRLGPRRPICDGSCVVVSPEQHRQFYGGFDPQDAPAYRIADAARYLHLPSSTLRWWVLGGEYQTTGGIDVSTPIIQLADARHRLMSFRNLVEAFVLSALRRRHKVHLPAIRQAVAVLKAELHSAYPLADHRLYTDGKNVFIREYGTLTNLNDYDQRLLCGILDKHLDRVAWDARGDLLALYPFASADLMDGPRTVTIDPVRGFGLPTINGTGIRTDVIAGRFRGGESIEDIALDYARPPREIIEALNYERAA